MDYFGDRNLQSAIAGTQARKLSKISSLTCHNGFEKEMGNDKE